MDFTRPSNHPHRRGIISSMDVDQSDQIMEVYARYGLAMFFAQVLEHGIVNALVILDLIPTKRHLARSLADWEGAVDAFMDQHFKMTMGTMLVTLRSITSVPDELEHLLSDALTVRNRLAHDYFRDRAEEGMTHAGRDMMVDELDGYRALFKRADLLLEESVRPLRETHGITDEVLDRAMAEMRTRLGE